MNETACPACGLRNSAGASHCARCQQALDATQVTLSPLAQTVLDLSLNDLPAPRPRAGRPGAQPLPERADAGLPASARPTAPLPQRELPADVPMHRAGPTAATRTDGRVLPRQAAPDPERTVVASSSASAPRHPEQPQATQIVAQPWATDLPASPAPIRRPARQPAAPGGDAPAPSAGPAAERTAAMAAPAARAASAGGPGQAQSLQAARHRALFGDAPAPRAEARPPRPSASATMARGPELDPNATRVGQPLPRGAEPRTHVGLDPQPRAAAAAPGDVGPFAPLWRYAVAMAIDGVAMLALLAAVACIDTAIGGHGWPAERPTAFENLAAYLAHSGSAPLRVGLLAGIAGLAYAAAGARLGQTLGRMCMGLVLLDAHGERASTTAALWHALGCGVSALMLGAGSLWILVDRAHRSWASLLSRTLVLRR